MKGLDCIYSVSCDKGPTMEFFLKKKNCNVSNYSKLCDWDFEGMTTLDDEKTTEKETAFRERICAMYIRDNSS